MRSGTLKTLPIENILPNPRLPRKFFDDYELFRLADSIKENGIIEPLTVRRCGKAYELISGERRLRAAKIAKLKKVPCIIVKADGADAAVFAIIGNIQREELTFFEQAAAINELIEVCGVNGCDAAARLGIAQTTLSEKLRLLSLTENMQKRISAASLTERHARALLRLPENEREQALDRIIAAGYNPKETEKYVESLLNPPKPSGKSLKGVCGDLRLFSNSLNHLIGTLERSGVAVKKETKESKGYIEYKIKITKSAAAENPIQLKIC